MDKKSQQGIALIWLIIAGVLLIVGVGGLASKKAALQTKEFQAGGVKVEPGAEGEELVGNIKEVIAKGTPMKCTYTQEGYTGVSFIKGKKMYSEISRGGITEYGIYKDNCMWHWYQGDNQGTKMCFEEDIWNTTEAMPAGAEYRCVAATFSDSQFDLPGQVNFTNVGEVPADLSKILPSKERTELESAIQEAQQVLQSIEVFDYTPPSIDDITQGLDQINKQAQEQIQKNIEQQQQFQPPDINKMMEELRKNPPAVPYESEEEPSLEEQEYYYRKYILKDPSVQY